MLKRLACIAAIVASPAVAQDKSFSLQVPKTLVETGLMNYLLPRFSLKTGVRITLTTEQADATFGPQGVPVFRREDVLWYLAKTDDPDTNAFHDWLLSDIGKRTIEAFAPDGVELFSADVSAQAGDQPIAALSGDAILGEVTSLEKCGRCHVVNDANRMKAIGSTPSFALMRTFPDWQQRFETFFILKPHAAFTQVAEVTAPFPENLPSPIAPIEVTLEQIDAITAYVGSIPPADLGAPIQSQ
ncbi:hypothetical protein [Roseovarius pelagicus]|uniref:Cytochrome c domain-containing protein n=1 Tax=Roseovarius pelagicus TaxID=2980108 RepID=A0ABY6DI80_9RHOB|nr:hypothetical protein [Roseovarius pelagicus]UXX84963.1 hypothetical protein N7U68_10105 [Roseovarius pelagicus]